MRIIGKTEYGFILEATKEEVARLEGLYAHEKNFTLETTGKGPDPNELRREREEMLKKSAQVSEEVD